MKRYAANTQVSTDRSKSEIEKTLRRYGADEFVSAWDKDKVILMFRMNDRRIRFYLKMPNVTDFLVSESGRNRTPASAEKIWEQATRQRWRSLALSIKARLTAVEDGIDSFEDVFLSHIVMPNGKNLGEMITPQIAMAYETKKMPPLLGDGR